MIEANEVCLTKWYKNLSILITFFQLAATRTNDGGLNRFRDGFNPRIGSVFNDAFSPIAHQRRSISFGSCDALNRGSNAAQFGSPGRFFSPIPFGRDRAVNYDSVFSPSHEHDTKLMWPIAKTGMFFSTFEICTQGATFTLIRVRMRVIFSLFFK